MRPLFCAVELWKLHLRGGGDCWDFKAEFLRIHLEKLQSTSIGVSLESETGSHRWLVNDGRLQRVCRSGDSFVLTGHHLLIKRKSNKQPALQTRLDSQVALFRGSRRLTTGWWYCVACCSAHQGRLWRWAHMISGNHTLRWLSHSFHAARELQCTAPIYAELKLCSIFNLFGRWLVLSTDR